MFDFLQILSIYPSTQLLHTVSKCLEVVHLPHLLGGLGTGQIPGCSTAARARKPTLREALLCLFSSCF